MTHNGEGAAFSRQVSLPITSPILFILLEIYYDTNPIKIFTSQGRRRRRRREFS
jgi:hypothetical protein